MASSCGKEPMEISQEEQGTWRRGRTKHSATKIGKRSEKFDVDLFVNLRAKERFDKLNDHSIVLEKGITLTNAVCPGQSENLRNRVLAVIEAYRWQTFMAKRAAYSPHQAMEFLANAPEQEDNSTAIFFRGRLVDISAETINGIFGLENYVGRDGYTIGLEEMRHLTH